MWFVTFTISYKTTVWYTAILEVKHSEEDADRNIERAVFSMLMQC